MKSLSKDDFVNKCADLCEEFFPKGKAKERGQAMVLVAMITNYLINEGLIEGEQQ